MEKDIRILIDTLIDVLGALDANGDCDCGGSAICPICNAQNIIAEMEDKYHNPIMSNSCVMEK
jgi:hypothetical protein